MPQQRGGRQRRLTCILHPIGKAESELLQAMKDYKSGKRQDAAMKEVMSKLSDQDLADLAAYYAAMK